jgi:hypothetical protein
VVIADIPRLGKGGVNAPRSKEAAKHPLKGAEGAVRSTSDYQKLGLCKKSSVKRRDRKEVIDEFQ